MSLQQTHYRPLNPRIGNHFATFASVFAALLLVLAMLEQLGVPKLWLSHALIFVPLGLYLAIAGLTRTLDLHEFYCASRRVPPVFGGLAMAVTAIGGVGLFAVTGCLYLMGFDALALVLGLAGGFATAAILFVPYIRKSGAYTLPGFFRLRFNSPLLGAVAGLLLIGPVIVLLAAELRVGAFVTSLFASVSFDVAVMAGAGFILLVVALGGLRALTWTQSVQYAVAVTGYLLPLVVISVMVTNLPLPQLTYGGLLEQVATQESAIGASPATPGPLLEVLPGEQPEPAVKPFLQAFGALSRTDFLMLVFCILAGTATLPSLLMRAGAATGTFQSRYLMGWGTLFLGLFLISAPAYALFTKYLTLQEISGTLASELPDWVAALREAGLASLADRNGDQVISADEMLMSRDGVTLALPIMAEFPFIVVVFVAAAGIAATLAAGAAHAFAAGSAVSDDIYHKLLHRSATPGRRLVVTRAAVAAAALACAWYVAANDFDVLRAAILALTFTGSAFLPALLLSVWWKRATKWGVLTAMLTGAGVAAVHIVLPGLTGAAPLFGLSTMLAAVIGVPAGLAAGIGASLATPKPSPEMAARLDEIRDPSGEPLQDRAVRLAPYRAQGAPASSRLPEPAPEGSDAAL